MQEELKHEKGKQMKRKRKQQRRKAVKGENVAERTIDCWRDVKKASKVEEREQKKRKRKEEG